MSTAAKVVLRILGSDSVKVDPLPAFKFTVLVDNVAAGRFTECSGLSMERETEEIKEGGCNDHVHVLPGRSKQSRVTLKRGITSDKMLREWFESGMYDCLMKPKKVSIQLHARDSSKVVCQWDLKGAYPVKWSGPSFTTGSTEAAVESIELAHQGVTRVK